jgi:26S proteasome regulatory subunit T1
MVKGECQTSNINSDDEDNEPSTKPLDAGDIALLKVYGQGVFYAIIWLLCCVIPCSFSAVLGPYTARIKQVELAIADRQKCVDKLLGIRESDTGLALPSQWDLVSDKQMMQEEPPLQVARVTKIIDAGQDNAKYVINVKQVGFEFGNISFEPLFIYR